MTTPKEDTTHIRLRIATAARLRALAHRIAADEHHRARAHVQVDPEPINPAGCGVSMDQLVNYLCDQLDAHRKRTRLQQERAKAKRKAPQEPSE